MSDVSTMFLNEITVVDHAYITETGDVRGGSFQPSFLVTGKIDPIEKVVVDFSTIKKQMKGFIDDKSLGFDHKLWVIEGLSEYETILVNGTVVEDFAPLLDHLTYSEDSVVTIITSQLTLSVPKNAIKFVATESGEFEYTTENVGKWFASYLNKCFGGLVTFEPYNTINAHTTLPQATNPIAYFTYAHGLKDSTSWGCQNIAHGHLSFIQLESSANTEKQNEILQIIAADLDGVVFINRDNIVAEDMVSVQIRYTTPRGTFEGTYRRTSNSRYLPNSVTRSSPAHVVILETETTIEYLVEYIASAYGQMLRDIGTTKIFVSEGLSKGAVSVL